MRAMATALGYLAGLAASGDATRASRSINGRGDGSGRKRTRRSPLCHHGQNRAAVTRRLARPSPARARAPVELGDVQGSGRHARTSSRGESAGGGDGSVTGTARRAATAMPASRSPLQVMSTGHVGLANVVWRVDRRTLRSPTALAWQDSSRDERFSHQQVLTAMLGRF